jgi:ABC-2 type transport system ATP-binding protein
MEIALDIQNLKKTYGSFTAVNGISFTIRKGEIFGLLGPNGSGKSTTIRMLCGVITPTLGTGTVLGHDLILDSERIKYKIGYMSQHFSLYGDLTVSENLDFYGNIFGMQRSEIEERKIALVEMASLAGKENALARTLSGGWKQRLALGCALIHRPELLVLDEPTAGVDPVSRREFWKTITRLSQEGVTVLVTTHYMDEASVCDRIGFIYKGNLISIDTPEGHCEKTGLANIEDVFIYHVLQKGEQSEVVSYENMKDRLRGGAHEER